MKLKGFKLRKQCYQHVELMKTNPTQFEQVKTELKQRFYELNKFSGNLVNIGIRIFSQIFKIEKREPENTYWTAGSILKKCRDSLAKE